MKAILLDTNIISFVFKKDSRAKSYEADLEGKILTTSFMTVAELYQWAGIRNWGEKRIKQLEQELRKYIIIPYDIKTCRVWGEIRANCHKSGQPISSQDAWIAAIACQHNLPLATHNPAHFKIVADIEVITR